MPYRRLYDVMMGYTVRDSNVEYDYIVYTFFNQKSARKEKTFFLEKLKPNMLKWCQKIWCKKWI